MTGATVPATAVPAADARSRRFGLFAIAMAAIMGLVFTRGVAGEVATFILAERGAFVTLPNLTVPVTTAVWILVVLEVVLATWLIVRGAGRFAVLALGVGVALFVAAFLTWAVAGTSLNLVALLRGTVRLAVPLTFGALAGVMCERAGVINIGIEAQLLTGAFAAAVFSSVAGSPWVGLAAGILTAGFLGWILAVLSIRYRADQIIVGVTLVVFATGLTGFLTGQLLVPNPQLNAPVRFRPLDIPLLADIPVIGSLLFRQSIVVYIMFATVAWVTWLLFRTRWGLRVRSVGEHPQAADTVGVNVYRTRYMAVILGGMIAGIGGAYFTLDSAAQFSRDMTGGRGFVALAAMLVGRYHPVGAFGAALIFGFADSLATSLSIVQVPIPSQFLLMAPYLVTILVVAGVVGRVRVPAADGKPYIKE
jgi:general nucleoside transport system permease protein